MTYELATIEELQAVYDLVQHTIKKVYPKYYPEEVAAFLREASRPELTVLVKPPETAKPLEELAPFTEAYPIPETGVRYYLCRNGACARPVDSISEVRRLLEQN